MTPEELQEIERLPANLFSISRYHTERALHGGIARTYHDEAAENAKQAAEILPRLAADYRAALTLTEHIQTDLEAMHRANARAEATIADLREDLARARQVNEQAERVRDENERLRRDLAAVRGELQTLHDALSGARVVAVVEGRAEK